MSSSEKMTSPEILDIAVIRERTAQAENLNRKLEHDQAFNAKKARELLLQSQSDYIRDFAKTIGQKVIDGIHDASKKGLNTLYVCISFNYCESVQYAPELSEKLLSTVDGKIRSVCPNFVIKKVSIPCAVGLHGSCENTIQWMIYWGDRPEEEIQIPERMEFGHSGLPGLLFERPNEMPGHSRRG